MIEFLTLTDEKLRLLVDQFQTKYPVGTKLILIESVPVDLQRSSSCTLLKYFEANADSPLKFKLGMYGCKEDWFVVQLDLQNNYGFKVIQSGYPQIKVGSTNVRLEKFDFLYKEVAKEEIETTYCKIKSEFKDRVAVHNTNHNQEKHFEFSTVPYEKRTSRCIGEWNLPLKLIRAKNVAQSQIDGALRKIYLQIEQYWKQSKTVDKNKSYQFFAEIQCVLNLAPSEYYVSLDYGYFALDGSTTPYDPPEFIARENLIAGFNGFKQIEQNSTDSSQSFTMIENCDLSSFLIESLETVKALNYRIDVHTDRENFTCSWCHNGIQTGHLWSSFLHLWLGVFQLHQSHLCQFCTVVFKRELCTMWICAQSEIKDLLYDILPVRPIVDSILSSYIFKEPNPGEWLQLQEKQSMYKRKSQDSEPMNNNNNNNNSESNKYAKSE